MMKEEMHPNIIFSQAACIYIKKMLSKTQGSAFRLSIKKTGCSGYSYLPTIIEKINANDIVFKMTDDLSIYIDPAWLHLFQGLQVDYLEENKSGLKQKKLTFINPNESSRCGCGESFHIEE